MSASTPFRQAAALPLSLIGFSLESRTVLWGQETKQLPVLPAEGSPHFTLPYEVHFLFPCVAFLCHRCQLQRSHSWREVEYLELKNLSLLFKTGLALRSRNLIDLMNGYVAGLRWDYKAFT